MFFHQYEQELTGYFEPRVAIQGGLKVMVLATAIEYSMC